MLLAEVQNVHFVTQAGITWGSVLAIVCSWERNKSIIMAAIAGLFSWLYVFYFALTRRPGETRA
jgi:hypothetical protein